MQMGPLQLVVLAFDNVDDLRGKIRHELETVRGRGLIRLIDALFLQKGHDGTVLAVASGDAVDRGTTVGSALRHLVGVNGTGQRASEDTLTFDAEALGLAPDDLREVVNRLAPGTAMALALFEHVWAAGLAGAIRGAGGHLVAQGMLTRDAVLMVGAELAAMAEAAAAIERAESIRAKTFLDTLTFVLETEETKEKAAAAAAEAIDDEVKSTIAAAALRTLVTAGLIDSKELGPAIDALVADGQIATSAIDAALSVTDAMSVKEAGLSAEPAPDRADPAARDE